MDILNIPKSWNKRILFGMSYLVIVIYFLIGNISSAQTPPDFLKCFPLVEYSVTYNRKTPYQAEIINIFDHSNESGVISAVTGESSTSAVGACSEQENIKFSFYGNYIGDNNSNRLCSDGHLGYDFVAKVGDSVYAAADGLVTRVGSDASKGSFVIIRHDINRVTYHTHYYHLSSGSVSVTENNNVVVGQKIGTVGTIGTPGSNIPHLHFEVRKFVDGTDCAVDPYGWQGSNILWDFFDKCNGYSLVNLEEKSPVVDTISCPADMGFYKINIQTPGKITINLDVPTGKNYDLELYDSKWIKVAGSYQINNTKRIDYPSDGNSCAAPGDYIIRVYGVKGNFDVNDKYSLSYQLSTSTPSILY